MNRLATTTAALALLAGSAICSDVSIELTGTVCSNSYTSGMFAGATVGSPAVLSFRVATPGTDVAPGQFTNYAIDLATFDLDSNGPTGAALGGPTNLGIQNDFPVADGFHIFQTQLATGHFFTCEFGTGGSFFSSTDLTLLAGTYDVASNLTSFGYTIQGQGGSLEIFPETLRIFGGPVGTNYCITTANSTGATSEILATGSGSISANDLVLTAGNMPDQPGIFIAGPTTGQIPFFNGFLCIGQVGLQRFADQTAASGGVISESVDLATSAPGGLNVVAGSSYFYQRWYRDPVAGGGNANFTDGIEIAYTP